MMKPDSKIDTGVAMHAMDTQSETSSHRFSASTAARAMVESDCVPSSPEARELAASSKDATQAAASFRIGSSHGKASSQMAKKRLRRNPIPKLLGLAFAAAKEADEARAREYLRQAVGHGWTPNPKTETDLQHTLALARRDLGIKDVKDVDTGTESGTE